MKALALVLALVAVAAAGAGAWTLLDSEDEPQPDFYGVVSQSHLEESDFDLMDEADVSTLRLLIVWNDELQPGPGECCSWHPYDRVIRAAAERGIEVRPFLLGVPTWVHEEGAPHPPLSGEAQDSWTTWVRDLVGRYGPTGTLVEGGQLAAPVEQWQVWNEPSSPDYWGGDPDPEGYAELLQSTSAAIREVDPEAEVTTAGLFAVPTRSGRRMLLGDFLRRLYEVPGVEESFDEVALHPYAARLPGLSEAIEEAREVMDAAGDEETPIRVTELGWASDDPGEPLVKGIDGQARSLARALSLLSERSEEWNISGVDWFAWRDVPHGPGVCAFCVHAGLLTEGGQPKPAYEAFRDLTN